MEVFNGSRCFWFDSRRKAILFILQSLSNHFLGVILLILVFDFVDFSLRECLAASRKICCARFTASSLPSLDSAKSLFMKSAISAWILCDLRLDENLILESFSYMNWGGRLVTLFEEICSLGLDCKELSTLGLNQPTNWLWSDIDTKVVLLRGDQSRRKDLDCNASTTLVSFLPWYVGRPSVSPFVRPLRILKSKCLHISSNCLPWLFMLPSKLCRVGKWRDTSDLSFLIRLFPAFDTESDYVPVRALKSPRRTTCPFAR